MNGIRNRSGLIVLLSSLFYFLFMINTDGFVVPRQPPNHSLRRSQIATTEEHNTDEIALQRREEFVKETCGIAILSIAAIGAQPSIGTAAEEKAATATTTSETSSSSSVVTSAPATQSSSAWQESISGFIAGGTLTVTKTVVKYPLDTITVRLQMPSNANATTSTTSLALLFTDLYVGIWNPLLANIPGGAIFFAVKDAVKSYLRQQQSLHLSKAWITCIAVFIANFPYWLIRNPSEVIKTKQQAAAVVVVPGMGSTSNTSNDNTNSAAPVSPWEALELERRRFGWQCLYVGYFENILYAYPADVFKFLIYDQLTLTTNSGSAILPLFFIDPSSLEGSALAGAIATATAQFVTTPLDVIRNRVMTNSTTSMTRTSTSRKDRTTKLMMTTRTATTSTNWIGTYVATMMDIYSKEDGIRTLFKGSIPRVCKAFLSGAIQFVTYEETKQQILQWLGVVRNE